MGIASDAGPQRGSGGLGAAGVWPNTPQHFFFHRLMIAETRRGGAAVCVKGGAPRVFGRGGGETDALRAAGIEVEVTRGTCTGIAAGAVIGIPVADRRHAPGVALVTGHSREGGCGPDWAALARSGPTIVTYTSLTRCAGLAAKLLAAGLPGQAPVALIEKRCTPAIRAHRTTLERLADDAASLGFASPALIVVVDVTNPGSLASSGRERTGTG